MPVQKLSGRGKEIEWSADLSIGPTSLLEGREGRRYFSLAHGSRIITPHNLFLDPDEILSWLLSYPHYQQTLILN